MSVLGELRRRNVIRVGLAYLVLGWVVIQVTDIVAPALMLPDWTLRLVIWIGIIGFPFALFFAWAFEVTPEGIKLESEVDRSQSVTPATGRRLDLFAIAMLLVAIGLLAVDRMYPSVSETPAGQAALPGAANKPIVAVLPFKASGSDDGGFLAAGLHDDLLTRLARLETFTVISRTSVMEYADTNMNMREIGEQLGAGYILEGGVQALGERVRINAQLIDAATDGHVWADTYDRALTAESLFDVQAELATAIAVQMETTLSDSDIALMAETPTRNTEAYNAYMRGLELRDRGSFSTTTIGRAAEAFKKAVELDPAFFEAWAQLAISHARLAQISNDEQAGRRALETLEQAQSLRASAPEVELARAIYLYRVERDYAGSLAVLEGLTARSELSTQVLIRKAFLHGRLGQYDAAYTSMLAARSLDPRSTEIATDLVSRAIDAGNCTAAERHATELLELAPDLPKARASLANYELNCTGNATRASELLRGIDFENEEAFVIFTASIAASHERDYERLLELAQQPIIDSGWEGRIGDSLWTAMAYHALGRKDEMRAQLAMVSDELAAMEAAGKGGSRVYSLAMLRSASLEGDKKATLQWVEEDRRRFRREYRGDISVEKFNRQLYAVQLARVGLADEALQELEAMLDGGGGFTFLFVENTPGFDNLRQHEGYLALRARYGDTP